MATNPSDFDKPTAVDRTFTRVFGVLLTLGIGLAHNYLLEVRGRKTGRIYATAVDVLTLNGQRFLVAPRGRTQWVRNAEAGCGVRLRKGRHTEDVRLRRVPDEQKPEVLKAYLDRFKLSVQRYFPIPAGSPVADFTSLVDRYPVFELLGNS